MAARRSPPASTPAHASATTQRTERVETTSTPPEKGTQMSSTTRKVALLSAGLALALTSAACTAERTPEGGGGDSTETAEGTDQPAEAEGGGLVGIAMPTRSLERWNNDGSHLESVLQEAGYETSLQYADNEVDQQITQVQNMINQGAEILVIA